MIRPMFWRFVTSRWVALFGLLLAFVGVPGTAQDAVVWWGWFGQMHRTMSTVTAAIGVFLVLAYLLANRKVINSFRSKLFAAIRAAFAAFQGVMRPPVVHRAVQGEPGSGATCESNRWEIMDNTVRRTGLIAGEAYPALVGMAKVRELRGERHLYMAMFLHRSGSHMELRIEAHHDPIARRRAVVRVDGEVLSDMTFAPCLTPVVSDLQRRASIREEAAHLVHAGDVLTVSVTDTEAGPSGQRERIHDLLRVPLAGYTDTNQRLSAIANGVLTASVLNYSPPEFSSALSPQLIDQHMRLIADSAAYDEWRAEMSKVFSGVSRKAERSNQ